jgi:hypothetical protein
MRAFVQTKLPCAAEQAWDRVQTLSLLCEVCWPLITLRPGAGEAAIPERWEPGATVSLRPRLFGLIPIGTRVLHWEKVDAATREMQTREYDPLIRRWDHRIQVEPTGPNSCRYTDDVEINAGALTFPVWLFAQLFYRHRQRRWKRVAKRLHQEAPPCGQPELLHANSRLEKDLPA